MEKSSSSSTSRRPQEEEGAHPKAKPIFSVKIFQELKNSNFLFKEPNAIVLDKEDFPVSSQPTRREMMMRQQIANYL
ncbi:hypothetical protein SLEP1_g39758 [Rubroshorea leprosula]|uniref:Uncharacterized protein n=1 Tax=Rubroshorea leprosula TaxID=152421 RepID=A0AAV5L1G5_9ROSI|nr:hypothetical protein SLEP1_g39758 [Rubroshorea leprosula]